MKDITPILSSLGLLDSEIKTYLKALELGPSTAADLAKGAGLSRQAIYSAIDSLAKRGLMSDFLRGKKRFYAAETPEKLLAYAKRKSAEVHQQVKDLESALPELELRVGGEKPVVKMFEGKEGIMAIIDDMQHTKYTESVEMTDLDAMYSVLKPEDLEKMRAETKKRKARVKGLYAGKMGPRTVAGDRIQMPESMSNFKSNIGIYGDKVALVTFAGKLHSVIIESRPLTKALRYLFKLAFVGAKDLPRK